MLKATIRSILIFFLIKNLLLHFALLMKEANTMNMSFTEMFNIVITGDRFIFLVLALPLVAMAVLGAPLYFIFKIKQKHWFILAMLGFILIDYLIFVIVGSSSIGGASAMINLLVTFIVLLIFFLQEIRVHLGLSAPPEEDDADPH